MHLHTNQYTITDGDGKPLCLLCERDALRADAQLGALVRQALADVYPAVLGGTIGIVKIAQVQGAYMAWHKDHFMAGRGDSPEAALRAALAAAGTEEEQAT